MLNTFTEFLLDNKFECVVKKWLNTLSLEDQANYDSIEKKYRAGSTIVIAAIYSALVLEVGSLPFKITSFRTHMNGVCTCHTN